MPGWLNEIFIVKERLLVYTQHKNLLKYNRRSDIEPAMTIEEHLTGGSSHRPFLLSLTTVCIIKNCSTNSRLTKY